MATRITGVNIANNSITIDDIDLTSLNTDNISEGNTNLYYTIARANTDIDNRVTKSFVDNLNVDADTLDGSNGSYYLDFTNFTNLPDPNIEVTLTGDVTGSGNTTLTNLANGSISITAELSDTGVTANTYGSASLVPIITVDVDGRVTNVSTVSVAGVSTFSYDTANGVLTIDTADGGSYTAAVTLDPFTTTDLTEGTNQYYTIARANTAIDNRVTQSFVNALNVDADTLDGANGSYYLDYTNFTNTPSIPQSGVDFDPAGTDNSTDVTLAGSYDYLTISGQQITLGQIDYATDISNKPTLYTTANANTDIDARVTKTFVDNLNVDADTLDGKNTGTSGNVIPLLDGTNTWSGRQTINQWLSFENGRHNFTYNDGGGNFNIRIGNEFSSSNHRYTADTEAAIHWVWNQDFSSTNPGVSFNMAPSPDTIGKAAGDVISFTATLYFDYNGTITYKGNTVWHAGNDGSGSTLDADLLDGQHGSYYAPVANPTFTGTVTAPDFNSTSDVSLKENVTTISNAANKVTGLRGVNFNWKESGKYTMGVVAQEVEKVIPEVVTEKDDGIKTVNYQAMVGLLIEAIKEQQKTINTLTTRIELLENK